MIYRGLDENTRRLCRHHTQNGGASVVAGYIIAYTYTVVPVRLYIIYIRTREPTEEDARTKIHNRGGRQVVRVTSAAPACDDPIRPISVRTATAGR